MSWASGPAPEPAMHAFVKLSSLATLSLCLMACGGGGGSGTQAAGTPPSNLTSEPP